MTNGFTKTVSTSMERRKFLRDICSDICPYGYTCCGAFLSDCCKPSNSPTTYHGASTFSVTYNGGGSPSPLPSYYPSPSSSPSSSSSSSSSTSGLITGITVAIIICKILGWIFYFHRRTQVRAAAARREEAQALELVPGQINATVQEMPFVTASAVAVNSKPPAYSSIMASAVVVYTADTSFNDGTISNYYYLVYIYM